LADLIIPSIDEIWQTVPETKLAALDTAIIWLEKLAAGIDLGAGERVGVDSETLGDLWI
jgi:hypothetical protein